MLGYTSLLSKHLVQAVKATAFIGAIPYSWDKKRNVFTLAQNKYRRLIPLGEFVLFNLYMIFLVLSWAWYAFFDESKDSVENSMSLQNAIGGYSTILSMSWNAYRQYGKQHLLWNRCMALSIKSEMRGAYDKHLSLKFIKNRKHLYRHRPPFHKTLRALLFDGYLSTLLHVVSTIANPSSSHVLTSLVPGVMEVSKIKLAPLILLEFGIQTYLWTTIYVAVSELFTYTFVVSSSLKSLRRFGKAAEMDFMEEYRSLQVLQTNFDALNSKFIVHLEVAGIVCSVIGIYTGIRIGGTLGTRSFILSSFCLLFLLMVFIKLAEVGEASEEVLNTWKRREKSLLLEKFLRSVQPIRIRVGDFFYADRGLVITIAAIVIDNTSSLLVAE